MERLALYGGTKTVTAEHGHKLSVVGPAERAEMIRLIDQNVVSLATRTGIVAEIEDEIKGYFGCTYAVSTNTGTAALHMGLFAVGVCPGDEVLVPSFTWVATAAAILQCGAVPVFCDIDPQTLCVDPEDMARKITPRTKAAVPVHLWGHPADMDAILDLAKRHGFKVVEDASHAHGALYRGRKVGLLGDVGCFSMQGSKAMAGGEGGFLIANDKETYERAMLLGMSCFRLREDLTLPHYARYADTGVGWKYRIHPLSAGMALAQLRSLDARNELKAQRLNQLTAGIRDIRGVEPPYTAPDVTRGGWYGYIMIINEKELGVSRDVLIEALNAEGVQATDMRYDLLHQCPLYRDLPLVNGVPALHLLGKEPPRETTRLRLPELPVTESLHPRMIALGIANYEPISEQLIEQYIDAFRKVCGQLDVLQRTPAAAKHERVAWRQ